jgi:tellurite resistance protein TerC
MVIFSYFAVPAAFQHRVLFWGILGALIMRAAFILAGAALLRAFHWVVFLFGGFLVLTGIKILTQHEAQVHPDRSLAVRAFRRLVPLVPEYHGAKFTVVRDGRRYATLLLLVLVVVETTDVIFAVDSIPAIFAVTQDPFIVYTSNIFAILGLRALYFLIAGAIGKFRYLKIGLGLVLVFVGIKMLISEQLAIPIGISLAVVGVLLGGSILASLLIRQRATPPLPVPVHGSVPPEHPS